MNSQVLSLGPVKDEHFISMLVLYKFEVFGAYLPKKEIQMPYYKTLIFMSS